MYLISVLSIPSFSEKDSSPNLDPNWLFNKLKTAVDNHLLIAFCTSRSDVTNLEYDAVLLGPSHSYTLLDTKTIVGEP